eukprot:scaffold102240_cov23-Cyclotella_meneghiniana.AAC.1
MRQKVIVQVSQILELSHHHLFKTLFSDRTKSCRRVSLSWLVTLRLYGIGACEKVDYGTTSRPIKTNQCPKEPLYIVSCYEMEGKPLVMVMFFWAKLDKASSVKQSGLSTLLKY